jgi:hypothetical protein
MQREVVANKGIKLYCKTFIVTSFFFFFFFFFFFLFYFFFFNHGIHKTKNNIVRLQDKILWEYIVDARVVWYVFFQVAFNFLSLVMSALPNVPGNTNTLCTSY